MRIEELRIFRLENIIRLGMFYGGGPWTQILKGMGSVRFFPIIECCEFGFFLTFDILIFQIHERTAN